MRRWAPLSRVNWIAWGMVLTAPVFCHAQPTTRRIGTLEILISAAGETPEQAAERERRQLQSEVKRGNTAAMYELAFRYYEGERGVKADGLEAARWFRKAAETGHAPAMVAFGVMAANGQGMARNEAEAAAWWRKAADKGDAEAMHNLGLLLQEPDSATLKDEAQAFQWLGRSANLGRAAAMYDLARTYQKGLGCAPNEAEAMKWIRKAAEASEPEAMYELAGKYERGQMVPRDEHEAVKWLQKSAEAGWAPAMHALAERYRTGAGVPADSRKARHWMQAAANRGDQEAVQWLTDHTPRGDWKLVPGPAATGAAGEAVDAASGPSTRPAGRDTMPPLEVAGAQGRLRKEFTLYNGQPLGPDFYPAQLMAVRLKLQLDRPVESLTMEDYLPLGFHYDPDPKEASGSGQSQAPKIERGEDRFIAVFPALKPGVYEVTYYGSFGGVLGDVLVFPPVVRVGTKVPTTEP